MVSLEWILFNSKIETKITTFIMLCSSNLFIFQIIQVIHPKILWTKEQMNDSYFIAGDTKK